MNRRELLGSATIASAGVLVDGPLASLGVVGDGGVDDAPAIQAALNRLGVQGGGTLRLPRPPVHYRLGRGLKLPAHVTLEGDASVQYPFNAGNRGACALIADFADPRQWIVDAMTTVGGKTLAHDALVADALPDGVTYNCGVRNVLISSKGTVPFGGVRFAGCPGSTIEGVSIDRVGCGLLVNFCFGGHYRLHVNTLYYGVAVWDANANGITAYCAHRDPWPPTVPRPYRLPFMAMKENRFVDMLKLSGNDYLERPHGVICGSDRSASIGNNFDVVIENYPQGVLLSNAYATDFRQCYIEARRDAMACAFAATRSRFGVQALHAYLSGTGAIFDFGIDVQARIHAGGILFGRSFGKAPVDDGTSVLIFEGIEPDMAGAPLQRGVHYLGREAVWEGLDLQSGWRPVDGDEPPQARLDSWSHRVELSGTVTGGRDGLCFVLPPRFRPTRVGRYVAAGGLVEIAPDGHVRLSSVAAAVSVDGISFARW